MGESMTFHNLQQYNSMRMKIIVTWLQGKNFDTALIEHEDKVNEFNFENNVFFNQETKIDDLGTSGARVTSVILYAELKQQFAVQPPKQGGMN
jgi:hypothetical protein